MVAHVLPLLGKRGLQGRQHHGNNNAPLAVLHLGRIVSKATAEATTLVRLQEVLHHGLEAEAVVPQEEQRHGNSSTRQHRAMATVLQAMATMRLHHLHQLTFLLHHPATFLHLPLPHEPAIH